ncbi:DUF1707 SHOCT-like domain-containing protein [Brevibacterium senegalense]|uniref:DUF1707 SHOCT-like domain-containing protein n=1 Tax=Brevibacterium senegalense TaxID=1033736 RepID=UPI0002E6670D|nr:DUF1707 domain-containing protein [Brevibacterium senegalense]
MSEARSEASGPDDERGKDVPAPRRLRAGDAERDSVLEVLSEAHAAGRLDPDEVDERQKQALRSRFVDELPDLVDDLPEGVALAARLQSQADQAVGRGPGSAVVPRPHGTVPAVRGPGEVVPARTGAWADDNSIAIMSGREIGVAPGTTVFRTYALMGGDEVYLTDVMGPGVELTLESYAMWAGNTVYVPGGVRIVDRTVNIMAGNDISRKAQGDGSNGTVILTGFSLMAGHDVKLDRTWRDQQGLTR